ncbi:unnamed protein product [Bursaphelenchus xylophilus]|uniref:(pine wood nematode) hypothetical protein n=1 Tax=Bursaphelenchus xylophilus TaxID=6326 RepID=A0A1I7RWT3_BURXY|nr:unnamed protein product [Bursaphelenchus xylophilus]CAG9128658.1 unnamed protein product [Bursaphelenchus xylophilus]
MGRMDNIGKMEKIYLKGEMDFKIDRFLSNGLSERVSPEFELIPFANSTPISPISARKIYCHLVIYPNGDGPKTRGKISGFVRFSHLPRDFLVETWLELRAGETRWTSNMMFESQGEKSWGCETLAERNEVVNAVTKDEVNVKCVVELFGE